MDLVGSILVIYLHFFVIKNRNTNNQAREKMADQQQFCLRWNDFQSNIVTCFKHLRTERSFTDVTLACDGQTCKAHKMVLSACSPYFKSLLEVSFNAKRLNNTF